MYCGTAVAQTLLGQKKVSLLVRCPDFRGCTAHKRVFRTAKCVLLSRCPISDCPEIKTGGLAFTSKHWHVRTSKTMKSFVHLNGFFLHKSDV